MSELTNLRTKLSAINAEIAEIKAMSEAEVCQRYNCDTKSYILDLITEEELNPTLQAIETYEEEMEEVDTFWGDPAFISEQSYYSYIGIR